uniref:RING-type E3 ubiquitin transferase n=1 Tax=Oryza nivara TaxID=4536 RepID=A0A0E0GP87_ORYNI
MPPLPLHHQIIKVARDEDFRSRIGNDGRYFDLVDFSAIDVFYVPNSLTIYEFKGTLMEKFGTPVQCQHLWWWARRLNKTYRVDRPLTTEEEKLSYVGSLYVKVSSRPSDILPKLRSLAGFCASEPIELYEVRFCTDANRFPDSEINRFISFVLVSHFDKQEIKFDPSVMCEAIDIHLTFSDSGITTGDIICYQKSLPQNWRIYSSVASFLQHVCDHKEEEWKRHILEEEIAVLKRQADTDRLQKDESMTVCDQLKHERDNAVRQVNELCDQSTPVILNFSRKDLEQAIEHFKNTGDFGDTEYGHLYKGMIHYTIVAIKLSSSQSLFQQEISILRQWRHPNIITIIGACSEAFALIYEWLPNGNLEDRIVCTNNSPPLSWHNRTQIIGEICCALLFLHSNKPTALVHSDLRPCNILIDANYRSKLCNFGLSNLFLQPGTCPPNLMARLPYMDPEFNTTGEVTTLSDVYSLGVIILQLLTEMPPLTLSEKVAEALESDSLHLLIDKSAGDWPYIQAKQLALIGLSCTEMTRKKRPDLLTKVWKVVEPLTRKPLAATWPYLQSATGDSCVPSAFICPISLEIMKDPQMASDGFTYEAEAIRSWFDRGNILGLR